MKRLFGRLLVAAVLLVAGDAFRRASAIEEQLAGTQERLTTLTQTVTPATFDEVEEALAPAARIPLLADPLVADVRQQRALAAYWNGDYAAVTVPAEDDEGGGDGDADLRFLAANASFRRTLLTRRDRAGLLRGLDEVLKAYGDVLKAAPGHQGAAYNYEYVGRLRTALARGQSTEQLSPEGPPNMHGDEGNPPQGTKPPEFNVIVPMRPDERQEQFEAGEGGVTRRRG
jgi:hypothetical protein